MMRIENAPTFQMGRSEFLQERFGLRMTQVACTEARVAIC